MKVLVTGGLGFIGSHTVVQLAKRGHKVVIVDNLSNSREDVLTRIEEITGIKPKLFIEDATDEASMRRIFEGSSFDGVIHFAGLKAVGESIKKPIAYYYNNLVSTMVLSKLCIEFGVEKFVFSSSATVYGNQPSPLSEIMDLKERTNPYGETKAISERILTDAAKVNLGFSVCLLRYFNPIGAHESGLLGEDPRGIPNNLMPFITRVANRDIEKLTIFGDDYDTEDGTCVRDYIHVVDIAEGHIAAIENMGKGVSVYNLGTGKGTSVLELIETFKKVNGVDVPFVIGERRPGDIAVCYADPSKAYKELGWKANRSLEDMVRDAWRFEVNNNQ
ncbi:UDP-glucose 4-epimerase GalE [Gudongella oleilytica]|uniref:UDP-glucose 4-epimerase GalE n=1 Tax=Gudongella oleilytica TaxID=1582259 RepID=UPI002A36DE02|nr:UDP-glucose 4-epimerase GalE [Gudongella oleilytica]MDY0257663.1 UDP-glucose 4-epimerase GalE [Gudongella oleilytica]